MPVQFKIKEAVFYYPEGWQDVTLERFLQSLDSVEAKKPAVLKDLQAANSDTIRKQVLDGIDYDVYGLEIMPYFLLYTAFWTGCPIDTLGKVKTDVLEALYKQIETNFNRSIGDSKTATPTIDHNGQTWYLPEKHMVKSTVNEFIELSQYEHKAKQLKQNQLSVLPEMLCILLKKTPGGGYNPECLKRKPLFMSLTMDKVFQVSFFFLKLNMKLKQNFLIYTALNRLNYLQSNAGPVH